MSLSRTVTFDLVPDSRDPYQRLAREVIHRAVQDFMEPRSDTAYWVQVDAAKFLLRRTDPGTQFWFRLADIDLDWWRASRPATWEQQLRTLLSHARLPQEGLTCQTRSTALTPSANAVASLLPAGSGTSPCVETAPADSRPTMWSV